MKPFIQHQLLIQIQVMYTPALYKHVYAIQKGTSQNAPRKD